MKIFTLKLLKLHINQQSAPSVLCDLLKDFPYQVVVLQNSNILNFKLLKKSLSGVATWRGDTAVAQLKPAGNSCQPQYFIFQVVPASTYTIITPLGEMTQCGSFESNLGGEQWPEPILCANVAPRFAPTCVQYKLHQVILEQTS